MLNSFLLNQEADKMNISEGVLGVRSVVVVPTHMLRDYQGDLFLIISQSLDSAGFDSKGLFD